ncbi:MAG: hypothetical protein RLZZ562_1273 [Planctomycetota bacterium]|jgi:hypothetical protein
MTSQPPSEPNAETPSGPAAPDSIEGIGAVALRLLAGTVSRKTLDALQRTVLASPDEYPWRVVNQVVLGEAVDEQELAQKGLRAQRDWILRGGRENPGKPLGLQAKTFLARIVAQALFGLLFAILLVVLLWGLKVRWPAFDIYWPLEWLRSTFPSLLPK